ncbi:RICIN domain-containing protein [Streptomyces sp. NBC_01285]|uniref:RICIN domain-containing protein n=1 Tax=unclassified Streptomyces TaxID=2593676 RepID=UPI00338DD9AF
MERGPPPAVAPGTVDDGHYRLVLRHSGKVLELTHTHDGARNGLPARQQEWHNTDNQKFRLDPLT